MSTQTLTSILLIGLSILGIWSTVLTILLMQQKQFFKNFTKGITKKDLKSSLKNIATSLKTLNEEVERVDKDLESTQREIQKHFQKFGFVRFNPYSDTGSNQSFCLCLLDNYNNGIVITSLHSREQTRMYAKAITKGETEDRQFSKEEALAVKQALK